MVLRNLQFKIKVKDRMLLLLEEEEPNKIIQPNGLHITLLKLPLEILKLNNKLKSLLLLLLLRIRLQIQMLVDRKIIPKNGQSITSRLVKLDIRFDSVLSFSLSSSFSFRTDIFDQMIFFC